MEARSAGRAEDGPSWAPFEDLRRRYGLDYNAGREVGFRDADRRGYAGPGHWDNETRWAWSARGIALAAVQYAGLRLEGGWRCLDVGCGRGRLVDHLRARGVLAAGIDLGDDVRTPVGCVGNAVDLPFASAAFDVVVALDIVEHVPLEWQTELALELRRVGRGLTLVTVPTRPPHFALESSAGPRNHYICQPAQDWHRHFGYHGFTIVAEGSELAPLGAPFDHGEDNYPFALGVA